MTQQLQKIQRFDDIAEITIGWRDVQTGLVKITCSKVAEQISHNSTQTADRVMAGTNLLCSIGVLAVSGALLAAVTLLLGGVFSRQILKSERNDIVNKITLKGSETLNIQRNYDVGSDHQSLGTGFITTICFSGLLACAVVLIDHSDQLSRVIEPGQKQSVLGRDQFIMETPRTLSGAYYQDRSVQMRLPADLAKKYPSLKIG